MNLLSGSSLHQKIISVGRDSIIEDEARKTSSTSRMHSQLSGSKGELRSSGSRKGRHQSRDDFEERQALTFLVRQRMAVTSGAESGPPSIVATPVQPVRYYLVGNR